MYDNNFALKTDRKAHKLEIVGELKRKPVWLWMNPIIS